ncbi:MAG: cobalamin-dependent protein, partial [bacterium]|nr:cobalamin-dependent protein [bacterium]
MCIRDRHEVDVVDANGEGLSAEGVARRVEELGARLAAVMVYGQHPSASTQMMTAAGEICRALREVGGVKIALGGLHPSALPEQTLREEAVDFVVQGEGFYSLLGLSEELRAGTQRWARVPGVWYWEDGGITHSEAAPLLAGAEWPMAAWDLLPMRLYRAHNWHCLDDLARRRPYAALYTSFGCPFSCEFCCVNVPYGGAGVRYRAPEKVVAELEHLAETYGVYRVKLCDELFVLKPAHYLGVARAVRERGLELHAWAYARVDTLDRAALGELRAAGIRWLALGFESASQNVRAAVAKEFRASMHEAAAMVRDAGIWLMGNFIFGLPEDTLESMEATLELALELQCEFVNFYCATAYPGTVLYQRARQAGTRLPPAWHAYAQHAYEFVPLPTRYVSARDVLAFRDAAFMRYVRDTRYLSHVERIFGMAARQYITQLAQQPLRRKMLEEV